MSVAARHPGRSHAEEIGFGLAAALAIGLYVFGKNHTPDYSTSLFGKTGTDTLQLKSVLASVVLGLVVFQITTAAWFMGKLSFLRAAPRRLGSVHRLTGILALLVTLPVAYHCAFAYGVQTFTTRTAVHSIAGCFFYGAFVAKVTVVRSKRLPGWALPLAGGTLFVTVALIWYTSALWKFNGFKLPV
ncbi:MAG: DUF6529 family protein [Gaiellaceae bacterium]